MRLTHPCFLAVALSIAAPAARGDFIGGLDLVSPSSTFEVDVTTPLPALGWSDVTGAARMFEFPLGAGNGNGALIGADPYDNYAVQYVTGVAIAPDTIYTLSLDMGFVAGLPNGLATFSFTLGTLDATLNFTPLGSPATGSVSYLGNLYEGVVSGSATQVIATGGAVSGDILAVRWAQVGTAGPPNSDFFGIDNVALDARPVPEPAACFLLSAGLLALAATAKRRSRA